MTIAVVCPDCSQETAYLDGSSDVFTAHLRCVDGCQPVPEEDLEDSSLEHLASIRSEEPGQRS